MCVYVVLWCRCVCVCVCERGEVYYLRTSERVCVCTLKRKASGIKGPHIPPLPAVTDTLISFAKHSVLPLRGGSNSLKIVKLPSCVVLGGWATPYSYTCASLWEEK